MRTLHYAGDRLYLRHIFGILESSGLLIVVSKRKNWVQKGLEGVEIFASRLSHQGVRVVWLWLRDHALRYILGMSPVDTSRISPRLYVGGQHLRRGLSRMAALGISASVSLRENVDDNQWGVALERHLWLPTVDNTPPTLERLGQAASFIRQAMEEGRGVYVHCASGVGRAPTTAAAYLVTEGMTPDQAWELIRQARPFIRPRQSQLQQIDEFHQSRLG